MNKDTLAKKIGYHYLRVLRVPCVSKEYSDKHKRHIIGKRFSRYAKTDDKHGNHPRFVKGQVRLRHIKNYQEFQTWFTANKRYENHGSFETGLSMISGISKALKFMRTGL